MKSAFLPSSAANARVLILGSMPGEASLAVQEYYGFARNAFWGIMGELVGAVPELEYQDRLHRLHGAGIALWDVVAECERKGSLDSAIVEESLVVNDFEAFLARYSNISAIFFNGKAAERLFKRYVLKQQSIASSIGLYALPSTSPANASLSFQNKLAQWQIVLQILEEGPVQSQ
ncbi:MAG: DNA-deoxyinosine glycosylase [Pseudomonadales bacterium]